MTRSKYGVDQSAAGKAARTVDGHTFDSLKEARRYGELMVLEKAGKIGWLSIQPSFPVVISGNHVKIRSEGYPNGRRVKAIMDFEYFVDGLRVIEDVKSRGTDTDVSRLKRALVEAIYDVRITLV